MGVPEAAIRKEKATDVLNGGRAKKQKEPKGQIPQHLSFSNSKHHATCEISTSSSSAFS